MSFTAADASTTELIYLDNAATSHPKPEEVYRTCDNALRYSIGSAKRSASKKSTDAQFETARKQFAQFFNVDDSNRIIFTMGCTYSTNIAIQAFPFRAGDWIIMSALEHNSLSRAVRKVAAERGVVFHVVPYRSFDDPFDLAACESLLKQRQQQNQETSDPQQRTQCMIACLHASNAIGCILPIERIGQLARQYDCYFMVDVAQTAGVLPVDVKRYNIDILSVPGHKGLHGPTGVGVLYVNERVPMRTFIVGGTGGDSGKHDMAPTVPTAFETGTIPTHAILGMAKGLEWVMAQGIDAIHKKELENTEYLLQQLKTLSPKVNIIGGDSGIDKRVAVVSFTIDGVEPKPFSAMLFDKYGIVLRAGYHCAPMAHEAVGTIATGTIRASVGFHTTRSDIDKFIAALKQELL